MDTTTMLSLDSQARQILHTQGYAVTALEQISGRGLCNLVFKADLESGSPVIVRLQKDLFPVYKKEAWCAEVARNIGIRTPRVIAIGSTPSIDFHISEYVEGRDVDTLPIEERLTCWRQVGEMIRETNRIPVNNFGEDVSAENYHSGIKAWADWCRDYICEAEELVKTKIVTPEQHRKIIDTYNFLASVKLPACLCHGNATCKNFRVDSNGNTWLLDWGTAQGHLPEMDIAEIIAFVGEPRERASFFEGYGKTFSMADELVKALVIARYAISVRWLMTQTSAAHQRDLRGICTMLRGVL